MNEFKQGKILLIDDDENIINKVSDLLTTENYLVQSTKNASEAIELLKVNEFDLVLLDLLMPNINGLEALKIIRKKYSSIELPIIILTAKSSVNNITTLLDLGANDYILKGTDFSIIRARIKTQLKLKEIDKEYKKKQRIIKDIFDNSNDLIQCVNLDEKFEFVNNAWLKTLEYDKEEVKNLSSIDIITPENKQGYLKFWKKIKEGKLESNHFETSFITKTGKIVKVKGNINLIFEKDKVIATRCILKDVTETRNAQKEIKEKNQILSAILMNISIIVFRIDKNLNFTECLGSGLKKFGLIVNDELKEMNINLLYPSECNEFFTNAINGGFSSFISKTNISEKETIYFQNYVFFDKENKEGAIGIGIDITDRINIENDLEKAKNNALFISKAKSDFLALMSHEIRTPINGIIGMTELLMETNLNEEQKDYLNSIKISESYLLAIINNILDFSKIESGEVHIVKESFDLSACIEKIIGLFASKAIEKNINLHYYIEGSINTQIIGDSIRLEQILINLISNALKFTNNNGDVFISVNKVKEVYDLEKNTDFSSIELIFSISDSGIGICKNNINKLFIPFTKINSYYDGTGLGLAICEKLINLMDGKIWVESKKDYGSTFYFTIKVTPREPIIEEELNLKSSLLKNKKVLLVNKNLTSLTILEKQLSEWSIITECITDHIKISDYLEKNIIFDAILIDIDFQEFDISFFENLNKNYNLPPIIATSFLAKIREKENKFSNLIYQSKPIKYSELFDKFESFLIDDKQEEVKEVKIIDENLGKTLALKILIAEDNPINQKLLLKILEKMSYKSDLAHNGIEVLEFLERKKYDLIFMDMQMPNMDGFETTEKIINIYKENRPKIIALTANAIEGDREKCLEIGMDDYISKPISIKKIQNKIKYWGKKALNNKGFYG